MRERLLDGLIQIETWDWWKDQVRLLREADQVVEAEALVLEFKLHRLGQR